MATKELQDLKRTSFIIHIDSLDVLDDLTNEQAGQLFKLMKAYHTGEDIKVDSHVKIAFTFFKAQFIRDGKKYTNKVETNRSNGRKGGRPKKQEEPKKPNGLLENPTKAKKAYSDSDSDSKSDSKNILHSRFDEFYQKYPRKVDKKKALAAFMKIKPDDLKFKRIMQGLDKQITWREQCKNTQTFIPEWKHPTTWLNGENWEDELTSLDNTIQSAQSNRPQRSAEQFARGLEK